MRLRVVGPGARPGCGAGCTPALGCTPQALADLCEWESGNDVLGTEDFMDRFHSLPWPQRRHHRFVLFSEGLLADGTST